jgi:hypothetical protein
MTELTVDVPRLRKELEYVTAHREQWLQGTWIHRTACGTVGCLAGNTTLNAGYVPAFTGRKYAVTSFVRLAHEHDERLIVDVAAEVLGLDDYQANALFAATNSLYDLWKIASEITNGEIEVPADVLAETRGEVKPPADGDVLTYLNNRAGLALRRQRHERRRRRAVNELADLL